MPTKVLEADEMKTKVPTMTVAFIISTLVLGFYCGMNYTKMQSQNDIQKLQHQFSLDEISGLRNDMNREVLLLRKELEELKKTQ